MTQNELDAAISEIIIPQSKPRSSGNSFFVKSAINDACEGSLR